MACLMPKLKSGKDVASSIRRELVPAWGDRPITDISRRDVVKLLEKVVDEDRPYTAHHLIAYLSKLFNWAIVRDVYGLNGVADYARHREGRHRRQEAPPTRSERR